jgi:hypothetical protein
MPAVVTHTAIMLLARERLKDLSAVLNARIAATPANQKPLVLERRLLDLCNQAIAAFAAPPLAPETLLGGAAFGAGVSKLAVMGAMGPDIPAFSNVLQPGQAWLFDTIHKATPDSDREHVIAHTTDLALDIWSKALPLVRAEVAAGSRDAVLARIRAYVLGHLCHLAGDIVSHPFIADLEWHLGTDAQSKLSHADGEASHDAASAQRIFGRSGLREGPDWGGAWPDPQEVPPQLFAGYTAALEAILKAKSDRPKGFAEFEAALQSLAPPALDDGFLRDGYATLKGGIIPNIYDRGAAGWALALTPLMLPAIALPFLTLVLPGLRFLSLDRNDADTERQVFEMLAHALYPASLSGVIYQALFMSVTMRGETPRMIASLVQCVINLLLAVLFYVESGRKAWPPEARWTLLFALPLVLNLIFFALAMADFRRRTDGSKRHTRRGATTLLPALFSLGFFVVWAAFLLVFVSFLAITAAISGLADLAGDGFNPVTPAFWIAAVAWFVLGMVGWVLLSRKLRDIAIPEVPDTVAAQRRHAVRLFDEETLFADPVGSNPLAYPSGRRALARLFWTGEGTMSLRSDRFGLVFRLHHNGADRPEQAVPAPVAPMRLGEYLAFLSARILDHAGATGQLQVRALHPDEEYELPPGAVFAAHGDDAGTEADVNDGAARFIALGSADDEDAYVLRHAPKVWQSVRFGPLGPIGRGLVEREGQQAAVETANGYLYVHDRTAAAARGRIDSDTMMSFAGDLGALLCLGAMPHLGGAADERIFQVFRNWNLDRRRVNEWRMLIAGRAWSEKDAPDRYDAAMPRGAHGPADPAAWRAPIGAAAAGEAEATALSLGWVPAFRKWLDVMRTPAQDPNAATSFRPDDPSNQALSRAVAWLFDLPEPATRVP